MRLHAFFTNPKKLLYSLLILLCVITWIIYCALPENPLTSNFFAGFVQLTITVFVIDKLINLSNQKSRAEKFAKMNKSVSAGIKAQAVLAICDMGKIFDTSLQNSERALKVLKYPNKQLAGFVNELILSDNFANRIRDFELNPGDSIGDIELIGKLVQKHTNKHRKMLAEIEPYADPDIEDRIAQAGVSAEVQVSVMAGTYDVISSVNNERPNEEAMRLIHEQMWVPLVRGDEHRGLGIEQVIKDFFEYCVYVHKKAEDGDLYIDI